MCPPTLVRTNHAYLLSATILMFVSAGFNAVQAQGQKILSGHVPSAVAQLQPVSALPGTNQLRLVIGLPLHNPAELDNLLNELHDPASTNYHQWLTPEQFSQRFGPTEAEYQQVVHFAQSSGLRVMGLCSNRMLVDVEAPVTDIEKAFHVGLHRYPHPHEARNFYAPDAEPTVATNVPILHVSGLDNYTLPHRLGGSPKVVPLNTNLITAYATGSGAGGNFMGNDFRAAYVPGVTNRGGGQCIAIVDVGGPYYPLDVYMYETNAGLSTNSIITNIITTYTAFWTNALSPTTTNVDEGEEVLDIDMALSMAPDAVIMNYEGDSNDVFNRIATDNKAKQMTLSYGFGINPSIIQTFQQFLAQGQAMSQASGDGGADLDGGTGLTGNPYATVVGGVSLTTSNAGGAWASDVTWGGSGGGISGYGIPTWQQGINMTTNLGSTSFRNYPDVSMPADNIFTVYKNGTVVGGTGGTSAASPLWAGFMALVNQQSASLGHSSVGFVNPAIYAIGKGPRSTYTNCFHDITSGNTFNGHNAFRYTAQPGYDLCTGWGSPRGSNTISALVGTGTNDFTFYPSQGTFNIVAGGSANATLTMTCLNGLTGSAAFAITGLPAGITVVISPASTTNTTTMTITTFSNTVPGSYSATLTGTMGSLAHSVTVNFIISAPVPGATQVNLVSYYNRAGIYSDGRTFSGGLDGGGYSYSANLLGSTLSWNSLVFNLGPSNALDVVYCAGQTITLPAGRFNTLQILGTAVQGSQTAQTFTVTYTDNSTVTFTQSFSDWANQQSYSGESVVFNMSYRDSSGSAQSLNVAVDGYTFSLDQTKTVKSITLPSNSNLILLAAILANNPITVPLTSYYNRAGMYTDGTTFTNPATGGIDGSGSAYSATLLGGSQTWSNTLFNFGPANATNVISTTNQVITLPAGNYSGLRILAAAVQGSQVSQVFTVTYTNNTTSTFVQGISDWYSPQSYTGESKAIIMGHRNSSNGTADNRTFYLYGYSFKLNSSRAVQSIKLPNNTNVIVAAISLVPNWPPTFALNPFTEPAITAGQNYSVNISTNASDLNGDALTFSKVSGPAWLSLSTGGVVTGQPLSTNVGANSFVVSATDTGSLSNTATMNITVSPAPALVPAITGSATNIWLNWSGGIAPYQAQMSTNLADTNWINVGGLISSNSFNIVPSNPAAYYRIVGQ